MCLASLNDFRLQFAALLPMVENTTRYAFRKRKLRRHDFEDILSEVTAACWSACVGIISRGRNPLEVGPCGIVNQAVRYVRNGRRIANRSGGRGKMDVFNPKAQRARRFRVLNAGDFEEAVNGSDPGVWDNSCTPADEACFRADY